MVPFNRLELTIISTVHHHHHCFVIVLLIVHFVVHYLDPTCTLSGVRDHARETFMAKTNTEQVVRISNDEISFSSLIDHSFLASRSRL